jgi:hypothetical protein
MKERYEMIIEKEDKKLIINFILIKFLNFWLHFDIFFILFLFFYQTGSDDVYYVTRFLQEL